MKKVIAALLLVMLVFVTTNGLAGGPCPCDQKYKYNVWHTKPTCVSNGYYDEVCKNCGHVLSCVALASPMYHNWVWNVVKEPDCLHKGERTGYCSICGEKKKEVMDYGRHDFSDWETDIPATDHSNGTEKRICSLCGKQETRSYEPEGILRLSNDKSEEVRELQTMLRDLGYLKGKADGIFGQLTLRAVEAYQGAKGFEVTGIAYPQTIDAARLDWDVLNGTLPEHCAAGEDGTVTECFAHRKLYLEARSLGPTEEARAAWQAEYERIFAEQYEEAEEGALLQLAAAYSRNLILVEKLREENAGNEKVSIAAETEFYRQAVRDICIAEGDK